LGIPSENEAERGQKRVDVEEIAKVYFQEKNLLEMIENQPDFTKLYHGKTLNPKQPVHVYLCL
jgi:hypothetical protein